VTYGDCARKETLVAAGISRANVLVITFSDRHAAQRVLHHARELRPDLPVVVRALDDGDVEKFAAAGATEVVPEALESSVMLATHALALLGVPMSRVIRRLRELREQHYVLLRGFFHGATDVETDEANQPRLHAVTVIEGAHAIGRSVVELDLDALGCKVSAVRRRGALGTVESQLALGDVVVLLGPPAAVNAGEVRLLQGK
jgi:CPA2 family monovalent cation:H+ antiporter-2